MKTQTFFECQQCGDCCKGYGGVFVTPEDIYAIADYLRTDRGHFVENYCQMSGTKPVIAQGPDGYCIFWDNSKQCTIHPVKPLMCRKWPFLESILIDPANWLIMADSCPGIQTDVAVDTLLKFVKQMMLKNWRF